MANEKFLPIIMQYLATLKYGNLTSFICEPGLSQREIGEACDELHKLGAFIGTAIPSVEQPSYPMFRFERLTCDGDALIRCSDEEGFWRLLLMMPIDRSLGI